MLTKQKVSAYHLGMEPKPSELWLALRELYRWRKLSHNRSMSATVFNHLELRDSERFIEEKYPYLKMAYDMWKRHANEDTFFAINNFAPEED